MPNQPTTQAALTWLQTGQAPAQRVAEVARALALLSGKVAITPAAFKQPFGADVEMALLVEADTRAQLELVVLLSSHAAHKATAKHSKKLLFRARQRGVAVPEQKTAVRAPVNLATTPEPLPSFASSFDGTGGQLLFLGGWTPGEGPHCVMAMLSDTEGLLSAWYMADTSRTQQREMLERLKHQFPGFTVQVPDAFVAGRIRWGLDTRDARGEPFEGDHAEVRRVLAHVEPVLAGDIGFDLDPDDELRLDTYMAEARTLLDDPAFRVWLQPDVRLNTAIDAAVSTLRTVDETERAERAATLVDTIVDQWLDSGQRDRLAERFDLSSWLLATSGKRDPALRAVATARGLRDHERRPCTIGFVRAAVERYVSVPQLLLAAS